MTEAPPFPMIRVSGKTFRAALPGAMWLTTPQVAHILGVSIHTVQRWTTDGTLTVRHDIGDSGRLCHLYAKAQVEELAAERQRSAGKKRECGIKGCHEPYWARGWCSAHYGRWRWHGDPEVSLPISRHTPLRERLFSRLITDPSGCLLWTGQLDSKGYGQIGVDGGERLVHRLVFELFEGPIPEGLTLDHVKDRGCTHRNCANVAHLEPVTHHENVLRSDNFTGINARKTHCKRGHEFTPENTRITPKGTRACRECQRQSRKAGAAA